MNLQSQESCPHCSGAGWILEEGKAVRCACFREGRNRRLLEEAHIPGRYHHCTLGSFAPGHPTQSHALEVTRAYVDAYPIVDGGLFFSGRCGRGKTHLAVAVLQTLIREKGAVGCFVDYQDLLRRIQASYSPSSQTSEMQVLRPVLEAEVLLLDDLGGARGSSPWVLDTLFHVLNTRYSDRRVTLITSNFEDRAAAARGGGVPESIEDIVGTRVLSRLHEMCTRLVLDGQDYRRKEAGEKRR